MRVRSGQVRENRESQEVWAFAPAHSKAIGDWMPMFSTLAPEHKRRVGAAATRGITVCEVSYPVHHTVPY